MSRACVDLPSVNELTIIWKSSLLFVYLTFLFFRFIV